MMDNAKGANCRLFNAQKTGAQLHWAFYKSLLESVFPLSYICLRCLERVKNILPHGGLMVIYHGRIRKQLPIENTSKLSCIIYGKP